MTNTSVPKPALLSGSVRTRHGFALPVALFAMVIAAVLITGSTYLAHQESRIASAVRFGSQAFQASEQGVAETLANWDAGALGNLAIWGDTTLVDTLELGVASTRITRIADLLYLLETQATVIDGGTELSGASREAGMVVRLFFPDIPIPAALTTRGPTELRGNAEVHGEDADPAAWAGYCSGVLVDKPGVMNDDSTTVTTRGQGTMTGNPAVVQDTTISDSTFTQFGDLSWADLTSLADKVIGPGNINGTGPVVASGQCSTGVSTNWGDPLNPGNPCGSYFPMIHITGDAQIQSGGVGQGILLVDGDLSLRGNFVFHGIIIVQGEFATQGNGNRVYGAVLAGNADIDSQVLTGGSEIDYSSCAVSRAILNSSMVRPRPLAQRAWIDLAALRN